MTNAEIIWNYAVSHNGTLVRKDFLSWFESACPNGSVRSMDAELQQMVATGMIERIKYGQFRLCQGVKPPYIPVVSQEMKMLFFTVKERYPYAEFCIWQARAVSSFMQHIPSIDALILETDRGAVEAVYDDVREVVAGRTVLLRPNEKECRLYASGMPSLLVRDLISEAPVIRVDGVTTASLEKILVDVTIAPEFEFARGSELFIVFENADQMYRISKRAMLRYAARRGKKEEIEKLIESTML